MQDDFSDDQLPLRQVRAYSYVRMSTRKQLRGDSLRRQLERSKAFADEHSLLLDDSLQDLGVSAWKGRNFKTGALGRFLTMIENGQIPKGSYLLIESLDRLSREAVPDALTLFMAIINAGIIIVTLGEDRQIYSRSGLNGDWTKLIIGLAVMSRGHEESQTKSERIRAVAKRKREQAREGKGHLTSITPAWIDAERIEASRYAFTLNHHAETVRAIYEMAARGLGATAIARKLNADGVPAFKSKDGWYQSIIKALLSRSDVIGTFQPHSMQDGKRVPDGDPIPDYFPAAIDKDLFLRVQAMRSNPGQPGRKGNTFANLFTGLCHCTHCGGPMTMKMSRVKGNENGRYLVCANYVRGHRCKNGRRHFRYEPFEAAVLDHVKELNLAESLAARRCGVDNEETDDRVAALKLDLDAIMRKEQRLLAALEDGDSSITTIVDLLKQRQQQRHEIERQLQHVAKEKASHQAWHAGPALETDHVGRLREAWERTANVDSRYLLRAEAHAAIRELISDIGFDTETTGVTVVIANGIVVFQFIDGKLAFRALPIAFTA
ncbi:recombinase family protein [Shinella sumterensis]|uniref:recombinase family protein n=1 Tax=Shinella sumterensis TaxID=1967501 RepID=UPI003F825C9C